MGILGERNVTPHDQHFKKLLITFFHEFLEAFVPERFPAVFGGIISMSGLEVTPEGCLEFGHFPAVRCCSR